MREQRALALKALFEPLMTALGVVTVARQMAARQRIGDIGDFGADGAGHIKRYFFHGRDDSNSNRCMHRLSRSDITAGWQAAYPRMHCRGTTNKAYCRRADKSRRPDPVPGSAHSSTRSRCSIAQAAN